MIAIGKRRGAGRGRGGDGGDAKRSSGSGAAPGRREGADATVRAGAGVASASCRTRRRAWDRARRDAATEVDVAEARDDADLRDRDVRVLRGLRELRGEGARALRTARGVLGEVVHDHLHERRMQIGGPRERRDGRRRFVDVLDEEADRLGVERRSPGEHLVEHRGQRVHVAGGPTFAPCAPSGEM